VLRKQGYGGRNDQIAKYMQKTFESHIDARKKLLQEVSSKGGASPDILEAAFDDGPLGSKSPTLSTGEFKRRRDDTLAPFPRPPANRANGSAPLEFPRASPSELARFTADLAQPAPADVAPVPEPGDERTVVEPPQAAPNPRRLRYAAMAGAGVVLAIVIAASVTFGGSDSGPASRSSALDMAMTAPTAEAPGAAPTAPPQPEPPDIDPAVVIAGDETAETAETAETGSPTTKANRALATRHAPNRPTQPVSGKSGSDKSMNADEVFKAGLQAWVRGDTKTALASYKRVLQANPAYAAAWRNIGLVYEKTGDKSSAHNAFQRYLQLAPGAGDAAGIRARLESP